jgi:glycosyltransferase involved in cell wall biosynthesis
MLVLALCDVSSKQHFDSFLYICRELNRREVFRFLIPRFQRDKETGLWRERLQSSIQQEKLHCASLLEDTSDLHSLIDSTDIAVLPSRHRDIDFRFFLFALEALCAGKPVLSFDVEPVSGVLRELHPQWIAQNTEDFVRIASDIRKQEANLEQFSTELARSARNRFGMEKTVARYEQLYHRLLAAL